MTSSNEKSAFAFLLFLVLAFCFPVDASLTQQRARAKQDQSLRGAAKTAEQSSNDDGDDDDDDDDGDDDEAPAPAPSASAPAAATKKSSTRLAEEEDELEKKINPHAAEDARLKKELQAVNQELAANRLEQLELKQEISHLSDEDKSDAEIDANARRVANETESPAMGNMLGKMWKDMRMFEMPFYAEHVQEAIHHLKRDQRALEAKKAGVEKKMGNAKKRWAKKGAVAKEEDDEGGDKEKVKKSDEDEDSEEPVKEKAAVKSDAEEPEKDAEEPEKDAEEPETDARTGTKKAKVLPHEAMSNWISKADASQAPQVWNFWAMNRKEQRATLLSSLVYLIGGILFAFLYRQLRARYADKFFTPAMRRDIYASPKDFSFSLFGCFGDWKICVMGCLCPHLRWADTVDQKKLLAFWKAFLVFFGLVMLHAYTWGISSLVMIIVGVVYRQKLRQHYQIEHGAAYTLAQDFLAWFCCMPCAIIQEARESGVQRGQAGI